MAITRWLGTAAAVTQISNGSIDSVDGTPANNTFTVTIGGVAISQVGDTDVATTAAALVVLLEASTHPYFAAVTWTNPSAGNITGTADTAGAPFVAALTETGAGTGAVTDFSDTTACDGPNFAANVTNWSEGSAPGAGDDVVFEDNSVNVCWDLDQLSTAVTSVTVKATYTGRIGLRATEFATSADGDTRSAVAQEYREDYLTLKATNHDFGQRYGPGNPAGSTRIKMDLDTTATTVVVHSTAQSSAETTLPALRLLANSASTTVYVRSAKAGIGIATENAEETSTISEINVSDNSSASSFQLGAGCTVTTVKQTGGTNHMEAAADVTTVQVDGGQLTTEGDYTITTATINGGTLICNHTKAGNAITALHCNGGTVDGLGSTEARTWASVNANVGSTIKADSNVVTITNFNEAQTGGRYKVAVTAP